MRISLSSLINFFLIKTSRIVYAKEKYTIENITIWMIYLDVELKSYVPSLFSYKFGKKKIANKTLNTISIKIDNSFFEKFILKFYPLTKFKPNEKI